MKINMIQQNGLNGIPMGPIVDEEFETILNGLDFSMESLEADRLGEGLDLYMESLEDGLGEDWDASVYGHLFGPIPLDVTLPLASCLDDRMTNAPKEFSESQENVVFQTRSPISVLENIDSYSDGSSAISFKFRSKGRRSKRARSSTLNPWLLMSPMACTTSSSKRGREKKRKLSGAMASNLFKRCTHCEVTKTPQWREGPLGPNTLCNACGVRYRSGRLLPEYRPAASPTFIPSLHSNSHRKVIEMRRKTVEESPQCDSQNFVSYLFDTYC
ncbi:GATA transcription factor 11-like [Solanum dulcamara]|uniref:GATA transcription factor 11-like n=1 Tax=Solanum dulcamara TaxID=45834 RepID=UPI0024862580|nr:GATA transcription factor 11-like [Solanum dulcamara]